MRRIYLYLLVVTTFGLRLMPSSLAQESPEHKAPAMASAAPASGFRAEFLEGIAYYEQRYTRLAEAMPAEKYAWRPGEGVRSVGEVFTHIIAANYGVARAQGTGDAIVRSDDVREDFTYRANTLAGTPGVFFRRHGLGQPGVALLIVGNSFQKLSPEARRRRSGRHGGSLMLGTLLRQAGWHQTQAKCCNYKKIKIDTTHGVLLAMLTLAGPAHNLLP